jgi:protein gp37
MAENSPIEWTDHTWSPWEGCQKVGPGCDHCYAEGMNRWLRKGENWGPGAPRREYSDDHWAKPLQWNAAAKKAGKRVKVFPSVCDPFDNEVPPAWRQRFMSLIARTPHLDWLLLTKRIGNARRMLPDASMHDGLLLTANDEYRPPANLWLGATVVNQEEADRDIPKLLATPARVRFLSMEPLLGPVDIRWTFADAGVIRCPRCRFSTNRLTHGPCPNDDATLVNDVGVDWVIAGGESGHGARPMQLQWVRDIVRQCRAAGVPVLVKQLGREVLDDGMSSPGEHWPMPTARSSLPRRQEADPGFVVRLHDRKGGDWAEWPEDLRVREFPEAQPPC